MWQRLCGLEGSNSSYPPAARRAEYTSSLCSGNKWSNPGRYGVSSGTAPPWTHCVALGKSLYFSEPSSTFKNKKVHPLKNLLRGGHSIQEMLEEGDLLLVFPQLFIFHYSSAHLGNCWDLCFSEFLPPKPLAFSLARTNETKGKFGRPKIYGIQRNFEMKHFEKKCHHVTFCIVTNKTNVSSV